LKKGKEREWFILVLEKLFHLAFTCTYISLKNLIFGNHRFEYQTYGCRHFASRWHFKKNMLPSFQLGFTGIGCDIMRQIDPNQNQFDPGSGRTGSTHPIPLGIALVQSCLGPILSGLPSPALYALDSSILSAGGGRESRPREP
jgi:hypothetical protein